MANTDYSNKPENQVNAPHNNLGTGNGSQIYETVL